MGCPTRRMADDPPMVKSRVLSLITLIVLGLGSVARAQERSLPNVALPTLGGMQLWADVHWRSGWRIQRHVWTGHHRLLDPADVRRGWGSLGACKEELTQQEVVENPERLAVLIHGLGRTRGSWNALASDLADANVPCLRLSYASTRRAPKEAARDLHGLMSSLEGVARVDFVTHSLGSIVLREALAEPADWRERTEVGCAILLAPPSQGSDLARRLRATPVVRPLADLILGEALEVLSRPAGDVAPTMDPSVKTTVIAGVRKTPGGYNPLVPGDDDGVVGIDETHIEGSKRLTVRGTHTFLSSNRSVLDLILAELIPAPEASTDQR